MAAFTLTRVGVRVHKAVKANMSGAFTVTHLEAQTLVIQSLLFEGAYS